MPNKDCVSFANVLRHAISEDKQLTKRDTQLTGGAAALVPSPAQGRRGLRAAPSRRRLFTLSFVMLFVELALIRWTGANIIYLSYFSNFVLLGSFLGIGLGFLRARSRLNLFRWAPVALALLVLFVRVFPVQVSRSGGNLLFFGSSVQPSGLPTWVTLPVIFLAVAAVMAMIGEGVARTFIQFPPLEAYRLDLLGSFAGIAAFSVLSFVDAKPLVWGIIVAVALAALYGRNIGVIQVIALLGLVILLVTESLSSTDIWSPYYRISVHKQTGGVEFISVNGIPHQNILPASDQSTVYHVPFVEARGNHLRNVLVIGAGAGNDVAVALREGAAHVDAVEIDPELYRLGKRLNPDRPYQDPRVSVHIADGRAFLQETKAKYDLILFALPDSLTLVSGQSSLRLESYLFTREAMQAAKDHLVRADGVFAMYNYYRTTWLRDRFANTLQTVYGQAPCMETFGDSLAVLTVSVRPGSLSCTQVWQRPANVQAPATDDHPFPYLKGNTIPGFYLLTVALILLASIVLVRSVSGPLRRMTGFVDLFFMGAAFMLLETKSIVQFALLFGTTWFVNALVFGGVLLAVLAAVEVSRHFVVRRPALLYGALLVSLSVAWVVPSSTLLSLSFVPRFLSATVLAFMPIFLANMVFAQRFRDVGDSATAFAANLLGAIVGGVLEYGSLLVGYRSLLIVVAVLYGLAFVTGREHLRAGRSPASRGQRSLDGLLVRSR
jgi:spermidine synthase